MKKRILLMMAVFMTGLCACSDDEDQSKPAVIGYYGYPEVEDDNILLSVLAAKDIGDDYVEIQIMESPDGEIVIADAWDGIRHNDGGEIASASLKDVLMLAKGELAGYESIRSTSKDDLMLCLDIKDMEFNDTFIQELVDLVQEEKMSDRVIFESTNYDYLENIKSIDEASRIMYKVYDWSDSVLETYNSDFYEVSSDIITKDCIKDIHKGGKKLFVSDVNSVDTIKHVIGLGKIDGIVTSDSGIAIVSVNNRFKTLFDKYKDSVTLPFLYSGDIQDYDYVVQGLTIAKEDMTSSAQKRESIVISAYDKKGEKNSLVYIVGKTGELLNKVDMQTMAHVGGLAYDEDNGLLWITGPEGHVYAASWDEVKNGIFSGGYVSDFDAGLSNHDGAKVASFIGMYDGFLYVGSYTIGQNGILRKYDVSNPQSPVLMYEAEIPECIQGVTIYDGDDGKAHMILSQSHEMDDAHLLEFKYDENRKKYDKPISSLLVPEGTENLQMTSEGLYVLFESGSRPYRETAHIPNDKLYLLKW